MNSYLSELIAAGAVALIIAIVAFASVIDTPFVYQGF